MQVAAGLVAVILAALAVSVIRSGWREWRGGGKPLSQRYGAFVDKETRAGWDRSGLVMGLGFTCMAIMMMDFAVMEVHNPAKAELVIFVAASAGMVICFILVYSIVVFNRPKFLVPPRHRSEAGVFTARQRRHDSRRSRLSISPSAGL